MNLKNFASEICAENNFIKASFGGFSGAGKTFTASRFIVGAYKQLKYDKPILIIDNEEGSRFLIPFFKKAGIKILLKKTVELADVLQAFEFIKSRELDFLFIDSLTKIWYKYINDYCKSNRRKFMTLQDWGKILPYWQKTFADNFVEAPGSIVFTGRGGFQYDMEENDRGKKEFVKSGVKMKVAGETPFEPDFNVWMSMEQTLDKDDRPAKEIRAQVMKDRSDIIDGKTFINPKYEDFKPVVDYIVGLETGTVMGPTMTENIAPYEEFDEKKTRKTIVIEEAHGELEAAFPGTTKEAKIKKAAIKKYAYGTYSEEAIRMSTLTQVENGLSKIRDVLNDDEGPDEGYKKLVAKIKEENKDELKI